MDNKISISSLAKQHQISEQTLQTNFKSLFGFTPKYFFKQLKLNHVHCDLRFSNNKNDTVSKIANKWGFTHMGMFSKYYTQLFNENPSQTLLNSNKLHNTIKDNCSVRQEEVN